MVDPPVQATPAIAFSNAARVRMSFGRMPFFSRFITTSPQRNATSSLRGSIAGTPLKPMGERPISSITVDMVLAVYWPPHAPAPGTGDVFEFEQFGVGHLAGGVRADRFEHILNGDVFAAIHAGAIVPP